ncbi:hypothetical protein AM10699_09570 [Acaryochloris marina MBIC10699]|nr:hypothetical protein AM10699_09570 [Acaryochloris marina MBIC10699]
MGVWVPPLSNMALATKKAIREGRNAAKALEITNASLGLIAEKDSEGIYNS